MPVVTRPPTWLTLAQVQAALEGLHEADNGFDDLNIACFGLVDSVDPIEPQDGAPRPTLEDLGALTVLCEQLKDELENLERWRLDFERLRNAAAYLAVSA